MWMINGQVIRRSRNFTDGNGNRQRGIILVKWSNEALAEIGVNRFREVPYDKALYVSTGHSDNLIEGVMIRTHETKDRYTVVELKELNTKNKRKSQHEQLADTDWYVIRQAELGTDIPQEIIDERAAIRSDSRV